MNGRMIRTYGSNGRENLTRLAVSAALLTLTACGGGGGSSDDTTLDLSNLQDIPPSIGAATDGSLNAATDVAEIAAGQAITVGILNNDSVQPGTKFQLIGQPANGSAQLLENGELEYVADIDFEGTDSVDYALVAADGTTSQGTLYIAVACADCEIAPQPTTGAALAATDEFGNAYCVAGDADPDGDGYGWENNASCAVRPAGSVALNSLAANSDSVTVEAGSTTAVSALRNDVIVNRATVNFEIDVQPSSGVVKAADAGVVVYTAPENFEGTDSLVYSLTDDEGNMSVANIDFNIECASCTTMKGLRLSWPANPSSENVESYRVFFGPDENVFTSTQLSELKASDFSGSAPNAVYDLANDLNVSGSEGGCFRVTAVRGSEESEPSDPICFNLG